MKKLLYSLCAIIALVACSDKEGNEPKQPQINIEIEASDFTPTGGSDVISFTASEAWTAEVINTRADSWCSVNPTSGGAGDAEITVTTTPNDTPDDRSASIVIKAGTVSKTITVSQKQKDALTVTASKFEVTAEGGEVLVEVKANIDFSYEIDKDATSWVKYESTRALKTSTLVFKVDANEGIEKREAKIQIKSGEFNETVTIYQEGAKPTIILSQNEYSVPAAGETIAVEVKSNVNVEFVIPSDAEWITENSTRALSTNTFYFDIAKNEDYDGRVAEIKFVNTDNGISEVVTVSQLQCNAIVAAEPEYAISDEGGELDLEIQTNVEIEVAISENAQSWITIVETRALESKTLHLNIAANDTDEDREGVITISGEDVAQEIVIKQSAFTTKSQIIYTTTDGNIVDVAASAFDVDIKSNVYENGQGVITFDGVLTKIGDEAFREKSNLKSIIIPDSVTNLGMLVFCDCYNLESVTLPNGIESLSYGLFYNCTNLKKFSIPESVTRIEATVFRNCDGFESIDIPENVTIIGSSAFIGCDNLKSIVIPNKVESIGQTAFQVCRGLKSVYISGSVKSIGDDAFDGCSNLQEVTFSEGIETIGRRAFRECKIVNLVLPSTLTSFGGSVFFRNQIQSVYCKATTPPTMVYNILEGNPIAKIYVPAGSVNAYKAADGWKIYADKIFAE